LLEIIGVALSGSPICSTHRAIGVTLHFQTVGVVATTPTCIEATTPTCIEATPLATSRYRTEESRIQENPLLGLGYVIEILGAISYVAPNNEKGGRCVTEDRRLHERARSNAQCKIIAICKYLHLLVKLAAGDAGLSQYYVLFWAFQDTACNGLILCLGTTSFRQASRKSELETFSA